MKHDLIYRLHELESLTTAASRVIRNMIVVFAERPWDS